MSIYFITWTLNSRETVIIRIVYKNLLTAVIHTLSRLRRQTEVVSTYLICFTSLYSKNIIVYLKHEYSQYACISIPTVNIVRCDRNNKISITNCLIIERSPGASNEAFINKVENKSSAASR